MNTIIKRYAALIAIFLFTACGAEGNEEATTDNSHVQASAVATTSVNNSAALRQPAELDLKDATMITLSDSGIWIEGTGAAADGSVVTITSAGIYAISGSLEDGRIVVNAPKEEVTVALNGADITCSYGSPLYIYKASTATVHLVEGTYNALTDGNAYTFDDEYSSAADAEPNSCLYSKTDLVIQGTGTLTVTANCSNGITSKDTLQIYDSTISVQAVNNGINGKDSNTIDSASITVVCGGDAIRSTNDTDETLGWVSVSASNLNLTAGEDGIQAETSLTMTDGSYTITSGGGSSVMPSDDISTKGIKAGTALTLTSGTYTLDCSDDAVHSNGDLMVSGGIYTVSTGDDAFHADETLDVSGGEINILTSYEGLEGTAVSVSGGTIYIVSSDDGVNAADGSGFGGFGHGNSFGSNSDFRIEISGGHLVVNAGGDGLDSNGNTIMSGGTVIVSSTGQRDGALDYDGSFTLSGGTLLAIDSGNMPQAPSDASQYTVFLGFDSTLPAGTYVSLACENQSFVFELPVNAGSMVFSSPDLTGGTAYTLSVGGNYNGQTADGICSGGTYSGGTDLTELTLSNYITTYGNRMNIGNPGGRHGGNMGGAPDGFRGEFPAEGTAPDIPPDGEFPENGDMNGSFIEKFSELPANGSAPGMPPDGQLPMDDTSPGMRSDGEFPENSDMDGSFGEKFGELPVDGSAPGMPPDGQLPTDSGMSSMP